MAFFGFILADFFVSLDLIHIVTSNPFLSFFSSFQFEIWTKYSSNVQNFI